MVLDPQINPTTTKQVALQVVDSWNYTTGAVWKSLLHNWGSLEEPITFMGDRGAPRLREVREIEKREVGRLHCMNKWESESVIKQVYMSYLLCCHLL